ncbi:hypothetical protein BH09PAT3_BH09PAT3_2120 [soil metagenome]
MRAFAAVALGISTMLPMLSAPLAHAAVNTCTWLGATNSNFSTTTNWSGCGSVAPVAGDNLVFPYGTGVTNKAPNNDLTAGRVFGSITFSGTLATNEMGYSIKGNALGVSGGITANTTDESIDAPVEFTADQTVAVYGYGLSLNGLVSGSGNITKTGPGYLSFESGNTFTGNLIVNAGDIYANGVNALGTAAGSTSVNDGAGINLNDGCGTEKTVTIAEPLTLTGTSYNPDYGKLSTNIGGCSGSGAGSDEYYGGAAANEGTMILSGAITLGSDVTFTSYVATTTLTGALSGAHSFTLKDGYAGVLVLNGSSNTTSMPNGTYKSTTVTKTLSDDLPNSSVTVQGNAVLTLDGKRGDVYISRGATLMGTGSTGVLTIAKGATVAPGHSPGCLTSGDLTVAGTYKVDVGGTTACTGYDQMKVTGTVNVTDGTLETALYNGFVPAVGQSYTVIDNDGTDAVTGTFTGLTEGATFVKEGVTYAVTYKGGDGNDVVLTVKNVDGSALPKTPNTGMQLVSAHPLISLAITTAAAGFMVFAARRMKPVTARARR